MLSVSILEMYAEQFETLVRISKRNTKANSIKVKKEVVAEKTGNNKRKPLINWFAGPSNAFLALNETEFLFGDR